MLLGPWRPTVSQIEKQQASLKLLLDAFAIQISSCRGATHHLRRLRIYRCDPPARTCESAPACMVLTTDVVQPRKPCAKSEQLQLRKGFITIRFQTRLIAQARVALLLIYYATYSTSQCAVLRFSPKRCRTNRKETLHYIGPESIKRCWFSRV